VQVDDGGQVEEPALTDGQVRDVTDVALVRCRGGEVAADRSGAFAAAGSAIVVRVRRRSRSPCTPMRRITRATRLWLTGSPLSCSSAVILGAP
jgi:hypothetical protein